MVQRIEEILGNSITEYTPNAVKFQGLSLSSLEQVLQEGYTTLNANFNAAPIFLFSGFIRLVQDVSLQRGRFALPQPMKQTHLN